MYFEYGENEITYLRNKDKKLSEVIDQIGMIEREVDTDLFSSVVHHISVSRFLQRRRQQSGRECRIILA